MLRQRNGWIWLVLCQSYILSLHYVIGSNQSYLDILHIRYYNNISPTLPYLLALDLKLTLSKLHRACLAQSPLDPIMPDDIPYLLEPELSFLCVPKSDMKVFGPFQSLLDPLLASLGIPKPDDTINEIVIPCFSRQLPAITPLFPKARILRAVQNRCRAQLSMRTVSMMPDAGGSPLHLKLSLNCQITSRLRTISPYAAA